MNRETADTCGEESGVMRPRYHCGSKEGRPVSIRLDLSISNQVAMRGAGKRAAARLPSQ